MNLKDPVTIVLTQSGASILNADNERMNTTFSPMLEKSDIVLKTDYKEGDVYENLLWLILSLYADCYENLDLPPFTNLEKKL